MSLRQEIKKIADAIAPNQIKIISVKELTDWQNTYSDGLFSFDFLSKLHPRISGIMLIALEYNPKPADSFPGGMTISPYYYFSNQFYRKLKKELLTLKEEEKIEWTDELPLKPLGAVSGIAYYGKNSILHNAAFGSAMFLFSVGLIDSQDEACDPLILSNHPETFTDCKDCRICVDACPTGALDSHYVLNREKCLRHYMLEGIEVPEEYKSLMGNRLLGCDICQQTCPKNIRVSKVMQMPAYDREIFLVENYIKNKNKGLKAYIRPLSDWIGFNYARTKRVLAQCEIIEKTIEK
jgi:epoxyqueuosine reductase